MGWLAMTTTQYVEEADRLRAAVRELLAAHAEHRDTDSLLMALSREFPELRR